MRRHPLARVGRGVAATVGAVRHEQGQSGGLKTLDASPELPGVPVHSARHAVSFEQTGRPSQLPPAGKSGPQHATVLSSV